MGFLFLAGALLLIVFGFSFYSYSFSLDPANARIARLMLIIMGILGAILSCISVILFYSFLSKSYADAAEKSVIEDIFVLFLAVDIFIVSVGMVITLASSLLKSFFRPVIPVVLPLWGIISYFWCAICCAWSEFQTFSAATFVVLFGIGASFLLSFSALPQIVERIKVLSDSGKRSEIINAIREKRAKKESHSLERKRLREQKKRLKHPNKR